MKNNLTSADILRRIEIAARVINGETLTKADVAFEYNVAEITINRDLQWLRSEGLEFYSRKGLIKIFSNGYFSFSVLSDLYLSLKDQTGIINSVKALDRKKNSSYMLVLLSRAIYSNNLIKIKYKRFYDDETELYSLKPYELKLTGYNWILKAVKDEEKILKSFYISRIEKITITNEIFKKQNIDENIEKHEVVLRFSPDVKSQVIDKIWFDEFEISEDESGYLILTTQQPITNSLASWCISWWDKIEIVKPAKLFKYIDDMIAAFKTNKD